MSNMTGKFLSILTNIYVNYLLNDNVKGIGHNTIIPQHDEHAFYFVEYALIIDWSNFWYNYWVNAKIGRVDNNLLAQL